MPPMKAIKRNSHIEVGIEGCCWIDGLDKIGPDGPDHAHNQCRDDEGDSLERRFSRPAPEPDPRHREWPAAPGRYFELRTHQAMDESNHQHDQRRIVERYIEEVSRSNR